MSAEIRATTGTGTRSGAGLDAGDAFDYTVTTMKFAFRQPQQPTGALLIPIGLLLTGAIGGFCV